MNDILPVGKLPPDLLAALLAGAPVTDNRVIVRPRLGVDCAVVDVGDRYLVLKSDPITFATDEAGWYLVQVNVNDIATTGARPRWLMLTMLLPEGRTDSNLVESLAAQIYAACMKMDISVVGGHTEITHGLTRPILSGTLIGEVERQHLVTPRGLQPGHVLLLTKGVPIEGTALLAREFPDRLAEHLPAADIAAARDYLRQPGISVLRDAQTALQAGRVTAMHDPTEGGLLSALWEMAEAGGQTLVVDPDAVPVPPLAQKVCAALGLNPLATIASGALLLAVVEEDQPAICDALEQNGILCATIGHVENGPPDVRALSGEPLPWPERDEITRLYDAA